MVAHLEKRQSDMNKADRERIGNLINEIQVARSMYVKATTQRKDALWKLSEARAELELARDFNIPLARTVDELESDVEYYKSWYEQAKKQMV